MGLRQKNGKGDSSDFESSENGAFVAEGVRKDRKIVLPKYLSSVTGKRKGSTASKSEGSSSGRISVCISRGSSGSNNRSGRRSRNTRRNSRRSCGSIEGLKM